MPKPIPSCYWDSCCLIAYLEKEETTETSIRDTLEQALRECAQRRRRVVLSTIHRTELLNLNEKTGKAFKLLCALPFCSVIHPSPYSMELAGELRRRTHAHRNAHKLKQTDAQHLATAITSKCAEFWTIEPKLIRLHTIELVQEIRICRPRVEQPALNFAEE